MPRKQRQIALPKPPRVVLLTQGGDMHSGASVNRALTYTQRKERTLPDEDGKLTEADLPAINAYFARHSPDRCLNCPVTGTRIPLAQWRISDRLCMIPVGGPHDRVGPHRRSPVVSCTSPAGGVVLIDAIVLGLLVAAPAH